MKKFTRLFILAILWSCSVWVTLSQEDYWMNPSSYIDYIDTRCPCWWQPVNTLFLLIDIIVLSLLISLLLFPLRRAFKKAGQKPRYSIIPYRNSYVLIKMNSNIKIKKMFIFIYILICWLLILWIDKDYYINPIKEYLYQKFDHGCCEWGTIVNIVFRRFPLMLFACNFLILLFQVNLIILLIL